MTLKIVDTSTITRYQVIEFLKNKFCSTIYDIQVDQYIMMLKSKYLFAIICETLNECKYFSKSFEDAKEYIYDYD